MPDYDPADFEILYPGVHTERESAAVGRYLEENAALVRRGPIDAVALAEGSLPKDTPGVEAVLPVTEAMVRYNNAKYDPENRLLSDAAYARERGYQDILAMPCFGAHDDTFMVPYPPEVRDTLLVSQLNHNVTTYRPDLPRRHPLPGLEPPRTHRPHSRGGVHPPPPDHRIRGQRLQPERREGQRRGLPGVREHQDLQGGQETRQDGLRRTVGGPRLDVAPRALLLGRRLGRHKGNVGERTTPRVRVSVFGRTSVWVTSRPGRSTVPYVESLAPSSPYGMGIGGSRTLKKDIMDPAVFRTMVRSEKNGLYMPPDRDAYIPPAPDGAVPFFIEPSRERRGWHRRRGSGRHQRYPPSDRGKGRAHQLPGPRHRHPSSQRLDGRARSALQHPLGHDAARGHGKPGQTGPCQSPRANTFLEHVPAMKGKKALAHGLTGDLALVKSYVYDKYVRDGSFFVDLAWWIETIVGDIWLAGAATVRLPSQSVSR